MIELPLITHSRQDCFKTCRKKHWFAYELGLRPVNDAKALRMGSAGHAGLEALAKTGFESAIEAVRACYAECPENWDITAWNYECETIERLVAGYHWWYGESVEYIHKEFAFNLPLVNPDTGEQSKHFARAGKIDGIVRLADGRLAVMEHKFLSEELDEYSPLWKRLRIDHQLSMYVSAARDLGFDIDCVLYDVIRKPTIKPTKVPLLDDDGLKVVIDKSGERVQNKNGKWRQTADKDLEYTILERTMTSDEWGEKLIADIQERPTFYYQRAEVPRLESDMLEFRRELWDIGLTIRDAQVENRHYRTCNHNTCGTCSYFDLCTQPFDPNTTPQWFVKLDDLHPELGEIDVIRDRSELAPTDTTKTTYPSSDDGVSTENEWIGSEEVVHS